jgi:hypothetical protein
MLIQQIIGAVGALFVQDAFGFGTAESRPIGLRLLFRLMPFGALLESFQVDYIPHACPHHATLRRHATFFRRREELRWAGSVIIPKSS